MAGYDASAGDFTAIRTRELLDEHDAHDVGQVPGDIERQLREVQEKYPNAVVTWDDELQDVVVDLSTGRGA